MILDGNGVLQYGDNEELVISEGQSLLIPNVIEQVHIHSDQSMKILEVMIP